MNCKSADALVAEILLMWKNLPVYQNDWQMKSHQVHNIPIYRETWLLVWHRFRCVLLIFIAILKRTLFVRCLWETISESLVNNTSETHFRSHRGQWEVSKRFTDIPRLWRLLHSKTHLRYMNNHDVETVLCRIIFNTIFIICAKQQLRRIGVSLNNTPRQVKPRYGEEALHLIFLISSVFPGYIS